MDNIKNNLANIRDGFSILDGQDKLVYLIDLGKKLDHVNEAVNSGVETILLDNMGVQMIQQALTIINGTCKTEASGGITLKNIDRFKTILIK